MSAQVVYKFTPYQPGPCEIRRLQTIQDYITGARNGMEFRIKNLSPYFQSIERQKFHDYFRDKIKLV